MADLEALRTLLRGTTVWNETRGHLDAAPDLTGIQVWNADLRGADFHSVDFNHSRISGSDLRKADLRHARINGVTLEHSSLERANLSGAELLGTSIWRVCMRRTVLAGIRTADVRIRDSILRDADLRGANMAMAHMHNCDLADAVLDQADFDFAFLKRISAGPELLAVIANSKANIQLPNQPRIADRVNCTDFRITAADVDFGLVIYDGQAYWMGERRWDFFISHATEDKRAVAEPLSQALASRGQRVWLDVNQIGLGDSLEERISFGINGCLFGVVVLSKNFFDRYWTMRELEEIITKRKRIFVLLHNLNRHELEGNYPQLKDLFTISTDQGVDAIADKLVDAIRKPPRNIGIFPHPEDG